MLLLSSEMASTPSPLQANICDTERITTKREERDVTIRAVLAYGGWVVIYSTVYSQYTTS
jgi:hypothetical protein